MADQLERNTRAPNPEIENDDPLAELARIIGYERPAGGQPASDPGPAPQQDSFDLESELMRELDVLPLDGFDELDQSDDPGVSQPAVVSSGRAQEASPEASEPDDAFEFSSSWLDNKPETPDDGAAADVQSTAHDDVETELDWDVEAELQWDDVAAESTDTAPEPAPQDTQPLSDITVAQPSSDVADDAVLADMFRYELPNHGGAPAPVDAQPSESSDSPPVVEADELPDFELEIDDNQNPDWVETAPVPDIDYEADDSTYVADADGSQSAGGSTDIDFEDYLSAELDVFERHASIGEFPEEREEPVEAGSPDGDDAVQSHRFDDREISDSSDAAADTGMVNETPIPVQQQAPAEDGYSLEDDFLFDEAAEELLADFEQDEAIEQAGLEDSHADDDLETGLDEGISGELEDLFSFDDDDAPSGSEDTNSAGDLELDMEQVLAEAVIDPASTSQSAASNRSSDDLEQALAGAVAPSAMRGASTVAANRDEMAEAFRDLVSDQDDEAPVVAAPGEVEADARGEAPAVDDDWFSGASGGSADTGRREVPDDEGFFFDSDLIAEPDEPLETLSDIDVPDVAEDEPWLPARDFESEVDQDFSDILEADLASVELDGERAYPAASASAPGWGLDARADAADVDAFDDYTSLERELGDSRGPDEDPDVAPPYRSENGVAAAPDGLDGEYATGMQGAGDDGEQRDSRAPLVALIVLGVAVFAGAGAFGWSMMSGGGGEATDGPRIIRADKEPVKVLPENPGGVTVPNQDKAVYDRVAGGEATQTGQPALVNTAEEPVDVVQRTLDPDVLPLEGRSEAAAKSEDRLTADSGTEAVAGSGAGAPVISPRRVRTMIVRPDGSIVPREEPAPETAQAETAPAADTVAAAQPAEVAAAEPAAPQESAQDETPSTGAETEVEQAGTEAQSAPAAANEGGTVAPVRVVTTQPIRAPVPQGRPADQPVNVVGTVTQGGNVANPVQAPAAQAPEAQPPAQEVASAATAPVSNPGGYYVQIASQPTAESAQASWQTLSNRYSSVIGGRGVDIQRADIPGKGVFHRVRIPAGGRDEANALCSRYKAAGGSCFVSR